ncbi:alpha-N-arabinofuranosidase 2 [Magnaporthiopsis poae ATCC 64411]|uniref:non-reducing end alpha-L-arabinofuranosidase n=1 Tax=Magnaporthiopsis poae (strain ATCC 64411 / 73-15) TaxID=644358 RepID=A0A0C4EAC2_MAGP6|nr:alpha-N-arabinofuranosidase 2 [Magnaporthiopsis poae ATCC 64411]
MYSFKAVLRGASMAAVALLATVGQAQDAEIQMSIRSPPVNYSNVLIPKRADPHIVKHTDGSYFFTATVPEYDKVIVRQASTIQGLANAREVVVFDRKKSKAGIGHVWAPELHMIDGKWYIYFALGRQAPFDIRIFVIEADGPNPATATWSEKGFIKTDFDTFSLDATTFEVGGTRYLCWAQADPRYENGGGTSLFLAPMIDPVTVQKGAAVISRPDQPFERIGHLVNEGAYAMERGGKVYITYSASATDANYAMGLLTADAKADLMNPKSWTKAKQPIFKSDANTKNFGPGHSSFTVSEDGKSDVLVYHSRNFKDIKGDPLNDPNRATRVQKLYWRQDGTPDFGIPVAEGAHPVRLRSAADQTLYIHHEGVSKSVTLDGSGAVQDTQFKMISPGLEGSQGTVSFESASNPGSFLRVINMGLQLQAVKGSDVNFSQETTFRQVPGLADRAGLSFESLSAPDRFIHGGENGPVKVDYVSGSVEERQCTFFLE